MLGGVLRVTFADERRLDVPLKWFPLLGDVTAEDRRDLRLIGIGIRWLALDEDLSVAGLLGV